MRKNTDSHLKTRTVTVKYSFQELRQVLRRSKKKEFCEESGNRFLCEVNLGFLTGVVGRGVH